MPSPTPLKSGSSATALLVDENLQALEQLARLLERTPAPTYQRLVGSRQTQSLGKHVRHILEHYQTLIDAPELSPAPSLETSQSTASLDYEHRQREAALENNPVQARQRLHELQAGLKALSTTPHDTLLILCYPVEEPGHAPPVNALPLPSSLGRELAFLTSHSIHHMALLSLLCDQLDIALPSNFGVHPSTLRFWEQQRKAL
ncbi:hypothetical protein [Halomonas sp. GFAJ-1]|uniref:hypothetical protein n=1 Tax=Halomonas sp. GFAJ-1 TaxID=1118153 RepID=UPI00023A5069|nr:hypothetical protein [Halomonas sp. GFAJ-1]AVI64190.1 hypothetical protein BB497_16450 [Halomonas sp. GFAJ-1]EHK60107.1 hypothetical protein MOY_12384 [Halomonas sp. GFAJ-1]